MATLPTKKNVDNVPPKHRDADYPKATPTITPPPTKQKETSPAVTKRMQRKASSTTGEE